MPRKLVQRASSTTAAEAAAAAAAAKRKRIVADDDDTSYYSECDSQERMFRQEEEEAEKKRKRAKKNKNKRRKRERARDDYSLYANAELLASSDDEADDDDDDLTISAESSEDLAQKLARMNADEREQCDFVTMVVRYVLRANAKRAEVAQYLRASDGASGDADVDSGRVRPVLTTQSDDEAAAMRDYLAADAVSMPSWKVHLRRLTRALATTRMTTGDGELDSAWRHAASTCGALDERSTQRFARTNGSSVLFDALEARLFGGTLGNLVDGTPESVMQFFRRYLLAPVRHVFGAREMGGATARAAFGVLAVDECRIQAVTRAAFDDVLSLRYMTGAEHEVTSKDTVVFYRAHLPRVFVGEPLSVDAHREAFEDYASTLPLAVARVTCQLCQRWPTRRSVRTALDDYVFASVLEVHERPSDDDDSDSDEDEEIVHRNAFDDAAPKVTAAMLQSTLECEEAVTLPDKVEDARLKAARAERREKLLAWYEYDGGREQIEAACAGVTQCRAASAFERRDYENHGADDERHTYYVKSGAKTDVRERMRMCPCCTRRVRRGIRLISYARAWCGVSLRRTALSRAERLAFTALYMSLLVYTERLCSKN